MGEKILSRLDAYRETMSFLPPLLYMGIKGVRRDIEWHQQLKGEYADDIKEKHVNFCRELGEWLDVNSPKKVANYIQNKLKLNAMTKA